MTDYGKLRVLVLYSLIPPSALVVAIILFDPYQVIKPLFGMRKFLSNLAFGMPIIFFLWLKVWLSLLAIGLLISGLTIVFNRCGNKSRFIAGIMAGFAVGLLTSVALPEGTFNWRDIPFSWVISVGYGFAGAVGGAALVSLTLPDI